MDRIVIYYKIGKQQPALDALLDRALKDQGYIRVGSGFDLRTGERDLQYKTSD